MGSTPTREILFCSTTRSDLLGQLSAHHLTSPSASGDIASQDRSAVLRGRSGCATQRSTRSALNLLGPFSHARSAIPSFIFHTFSSLVSPGLHLYSTENHYEDIRHPYCCVVCRRLSRGRHPQVRASTSALPPAHKLICLSSTE